METLHLLLALVVQGSIAYADTLDEIEMRSDEFDGNKIEDNPGDDVIKTDWMDLFVGPNLSLYPTSSTTMMAQAAFSDKSPEEQLEDIKEMANQINLLIQNEIANLLSYAVGNADKNDKTRRRRSIDTPMDSTELVMRLLKHIKSNNEYQNIAIEKMMSAQEIADKYDIPFNPDTEILTNLAKAANEHATEITAILKNTCDTVNSSKCIAQQNNYTDSKNNYTTKDDLPKIEFVPLEVNRGSYDKSNQDFLSYYNYYNTLPVETQVVPPTLEENVLPVSTRPTFYDSISYSSIADYPYCSMEPMYSVPALIEVEPELVGEEYEEVVSSKLFIDHEEPGISSVNHVTTFTLTEKAHFKMPQTTNQPQQMEYYFLLR